MSAGGADRAIFARCKLLKTPRRLKFRWGSPGVLLKLGLGLLPLLLPFMLSGPGGAHGGAGILGPIMLLASGLFLAVALPPRGRDLQRRLLSNGVPLLAAIVRVGPPPLKRRKD